MKWRQFFDSRAERGEGDKTICDLLHIYEQNSYEEMAENYFNKHRTSPTSGILKAEAVYHYCKALESAGILCFNDLSSEKLEYAEAIILGIPGHSSGVAFNYFRMLAGDDNLVQPDRMVKRFIGGDVSDRQATLFIRLAAKELGSDWSPIKLDYAIWKYESKK